MKGKDVTEKTTSVNPIPTHYISGTHWDRIQALTTSGKVSAGPWYAFRQKSFIVLLVP